MHVNILFKATDLQFSSDAWIIWYEIERILINIVWIYLSFWISIIMCFIVKREMAYLWNIYILIYLVLLFTRFINWSCVTSSVILTFGRSLKVLRIKLCRSFVFVPFVYLKVRWIKKNPVDRVIIEEWLSDADSVYLNKCA